MTTNPEPEPNAEDAPHAWKPRHLADGTPTFVCRVCGQWSDADIHHSELQNDRYPTA